MGTWSTFINGLITANIISGRKNKAVHVRNVLGGISDAVDYLESLQRGARILHGTTEPDAAAGIDGDAFINTVTGDLYLKENSDWGLKVVLKGEPGKKGKDGDNGRTPVLGQDYTVSNGQDGKSAYQLAVANGYAGTLADWLNSLHGTDGERGSHITTSAAAPDNTLDPVAGDVHFEVVSAERFRLYVFATAGWNVIYTTPAGALVGDGTITNEKLTADVKVGSLSAAQNAYPAPDRAQLTTVEKFLVWLGGNVTNLVTGLASLTSRVGALEARPTGSGGGSGFSPTTTGDGTRFLNDKGQYSTPAGGGGALLPEQSGKAGNVLRTDGTAATWQDVQEFLLFSSFAALQAYPAGQRKAGQPGRVVSDTTAANNGDYTILADGYTWQKNGTAGGFEGLTAQTSVAANRYYEYTLSSPRIWRAKVAQSAGNVVFPVEGDATDTGGAFYWIEVSRSATGGGGTGYTDAQARAQAVSLLTSANKSGISFTYANGVLNATVNAAATRLYASFPAGGRNAATVRVLFGEQPGAYNLESSTGCTNVTYELNGAAATLPVSLQLNDSLLISATAASTDGAVILRQQ